MKSEGNGVEKRLKSEVKQWKKTSMRLHFALLDVLNLIEDGVLVRSAEKDSGKGWIKGSSLFELVYALRDAELLTEKTNKLIIYDSDWDSLGPKYFEHHLKGTIDEFKKTINKKT